jgi:hypothetical protein
MDLDDPKQAIARAKSRARSVAATDRRNDGVVSDAARDKAERMFKLGQKKMNRMARQGEADRHTTASLPKHLVYTPHCPLYPRINSNSHIVLRQAWHGQDPAPLKAPLATKRDPFLIIVDWFLYRVHNGVGRLFFFSCSFDTDFHLSWINCSTICGGLSQSIGPKVLDLMMLHIPIQMLFLGFGGFEAVWPRRL